MQGSLSPQDLVLIAVMPRLRDLEIARVLGWYRIPLRYAPKVVRVDILAFYEPASLGAKGGGCIRYYAPVQGVELTTREELFNDERDHPRAKEEYYKLQIGSLLEREPAVSVGSYKRLTFLYTTGALFNQAVSIKDLVVQNEERQILWRSLRERAAEDQAYGHSDAAAVGMDVDWIQFFQLESFIHNPQVSGTINEENR